MAGLPAVFKSGLFKVLAIVVGLVIIFLIVNPIVIVGPSERGVRVKLGEVQEDVLLPGIHLKAPFIEEIETLSVAPNEIDFEISVGPNGAVSKDLQIIGAKVRTFWTFDQNRVVEFFKSFTRDAVESQVKSSLLASIKNTFGKYEIYLIAQEQTKISQEAFAELKASLASYPIILTQLNLENLDWADEFDRQITLTMQKTQEIKQKQQELEVTELESQKRVKEAESSAAALVAQAEGEKTAASLRADAKAIEGDGIRKYNQSIAANLDVQIRLKQLEIEAARVEKWDGHYVSTNNYGPIPVATGSIQGQ